ncbi:MAG: isochorismatase family protein [Candidatus Omnitrophica bacterium]|nr:isochorismatase family protein [Candidatus Omnitrophota bacterium]
MAKEKALIIVDMQNDFSPGGKLAVPGADKIIPVLNAYIKAFSSAQMPVLASRDWHPKRTEHFNEYGGDWPQHCVRNTKGAMFHPELELPEDAIIISKGMDPAKDSYSAFLGEDKAGRSLVDVLEDLSVEEVFVGGVATDHCIRHTVIDALKEGYRTYLLTDAEKGVEEQSSREAIEEMFSSGAQGLTFAELAGKLQR